MSLTAGNQRYPIAKGVDGWQSEGPVRLTLGMVMGEERLRTHVTGTEYRRTVAPIVAVKLRGIAHIETDSTLGPEPQWKILNRNHALDRADGGGKARVFLDAASPQLYEGARLIGKISSRALPLRDLRGWGSPLIVYSPGQPAFHLVASVEDRGRGRFLPPLFRGQTDIWIRWRAPMALGKDHALLVWNDMAQHPQRIGLNRIATHQDGLIWKVPAAGPMTAMAVAYKGARIASYWVTDRIVNALKRGSSSGLFALLRWLKVPVLNASFREPMKQAVIRLPVEFVNGWLNDSELQYSLSHRQAEQGLDAVIREVFWNYVERNETNMEKLAKAFRGSHMAAGHRDEWEAFRSSIELLSEMCPSLAYGLAKTKARGEKSRKCIRIAVAAMVRQPENTDVPQLRNQLAASCRECASIIGLSPPALEAGALAFQRRLNNGPSSDYSYVEWNLRRLGETSRGREFLAASLLLSLLDRS
ncbi:MAG: hypothetical protein KIT09_18300 [Bryobacteraceae bacterium]|nr:hypothetical protein [Bryobacteraceae bacterium]